MNNKVALITGGASGIGKASAINFAKNGAKVFIIDINKEESNNVVEEITSFGGRAASFICDVTKESEIIKAINNCIDIFGTLDYAHNNAGIVISKTTTECTEEIWDKIINTNLKSYWLCMKHEILQMLKQGYGSIVNTASISGLIARAGDMPYNVSKFGFVGLTKTAALENADKNIRINCVCPGAIQTSWVKKEIGRAHV